MKTSRIVSAISFGIIVFGQGCSGKFAQIGSDQDASAQGGNSGIGGSTGVTCMYQGVLHPVGNSFSSSDGCNTCSCSSDGQQVICTQRACAVGGGSNNGGSTSTGCVCTGPSPAAPSVQCWDGSVAGPECVTNATGSCAWTVTTCPPQPGVGGSTGAGGAVGVGGSTGVTCLYNGVNYPTGTIPANTCCICGSDGSVSCANNTACGKGTGGSSGVGGSTGTSGCVTAADCKGALPALCQQCTDGSSGCAHFVCNSGSCQIGYCGNGGSSGVGGSTSVGCVCSGPSPAAPTQLCWDGSTAGPECLTNATGSCNWTVTTCPVQGAGGSASVGGSTGVTCLYNGVNYAVGVSFKSSDGCNSCSCTSSGVACTQMACAAGGSSGAGGSTSVTCPAIRMIMPKCDNSTAIMQHDPSTGCDTGYVCPTCPAVNLPNITCANYQLVTSSTTGCPTGYVCPIVDAGACPPIALVVPACANASAVLKYDASGCATGYVCP